MKLRIVSDGLGRGTHVLAIDDDGKYVEIRGVAHLTWSVDAGGASSANLVVKNVEVDVASEHFTQGPDQGSPLPRMADVYGSPRTRASSTLAAPRNASPMVDAYDDAYSPDTPADLPF